MQLRSEREIEESIEEAARGEEALDLCEHIGAAAATGEELLVLKACVIAVCQTNEGLREQFRAFLRLGGETGYVVDDNNPAQAHALLKKVDGFFERRGDWSWQELARHVATELNDSDDEANTEAYDDGAGWGQLLGEVMQLPADQEPGEKQKARLLALFDWWVRHKWE